MSEHTEERAGRGERYVEMVGPDGEPYMARIGESRAGSGGADTWIAENVFGMTPTTTEGRPGAPGYEPYRVEMSADRMAELERMLGRIPTAEDLVAMERVGIAGQASQAHQNLVSNAAQRGLIHSGILRAGQQKLTGQAMGQMQAATAKAQAFPEQARAQILASLATGMPLPEVTYERQPSGVIPMMMGLGGAVIGSIGGVPGATAGYAVGYGAGTVVQGGPTYHTAGRPGSSFG